MLRPRGQFDADNRLTGLGVVGDPDRAVVEHASTPFFQLAHHPLLLAHAVLINKGRADPLALRKDVLLGGAE